MICSHHCESTVFLNDRVSALHTFNPTVYIISALKTWYFSTWGTSTPPVLAPPLCAVCHHSQHKLGKPHHLKLSAEHCSTNWHKCKHKIWAHKHKHTHTHWMLTDEFLFLAVYSLCWQFRHILPVHKCSCTHAHIYKENMYTHPDTHTYIQWPSLCWVGKESGVSACCQPVRERKGEGKWEEAKEEQTWLEECTEWSFSASSFNKD